MDRWKNPFKKGVRLRKNPDGEGYMEVLRDPFEEELSEDIHKKMNKLLMVSLIILISMLLLLRFMGIELVIRSS